MNFTNSKSSRALGVRVCKWRISWNRLVFDTVGCRPFCRQANISIYRYHRFVFSKNVLPFAEKFYIYVSCVPKRMCRVSRSLSSVLKEHSRVSIHMQRRKTLVYTCGVCSPVRRYTPNMYIHMYLFVRPYFIGIILFEKLCVCM